MMRCDIYKSRAEVPTYSVEHRRVYDNGNQNGSASDDNTIYWNDLRESPFDAWGITATWQKSENIILCFLKDFGAENIIFPNGLTFRQLCVVHPLAKLQVHICKKKTCNSDLYRLYQCKYICAMSGTAIDYTNVVPQRKILLRHSWRGTVLSPVLFSLCTDETVRINYYRQC